MKHVLRVKIEGQTFQLSKTRAGKIKNLCGKWIVHFFKDSSEISRQMKIFVKRPTNVRLYAYEFFAVIVLLVNIDFTISIFSKYLSLSLACFSKNAQKLSKLFLDRPMSALNTSIFWVEYVAKYGNVLQSPAINLYWWQRNLLDVYVFILAVIITALCIVLFILRKLKNLLFGSPVCAKKNSAVIKSKKNK